MQPLLHVCLLPKQLAWLRHKTGMIIPDPVGVMSCLKQHWADISKAGGGGSLEQRLDYLQPLPIPPALKRFAPALFKPLSLDFWYAPHHSFILRCRKGTFILCKHNNDQ